MKIPVERQISTPDGKIVSVYEIHPRGKTAWFCASVLVPTEASSHEYSTIMYVGDKCYGQMGTMRIPDFMDGTLSGQLRTDFVNAWHEGQYSTAYAYIHKYAPEFRGAHGSMGEISLHIPVAPAIVQAAIESGHLEIIRC